MLSLKGKTGRLPYLIVSLVFACMTMVTSVHLSFNINVLMNVFAAASPGVKASASADAYGQSRYDGDFDDGTVVQTDSGASAQVRLYQSADDARETRSNYTLIYMSGVENTALVIVWVGSFAAFMLGTAGRFRDLGQSGGFSLLILIVPVSAVLWLYLILARTHSCDPPEDKKTNTDCGRSSPIIFYKNEVNM